MELLRMRGEDLDFDAGSVIVRSGQGDEGWTVLPPMWLENALRAHLESVRGWHEADLAKGCGEPPLPDAIVGT